MLILLSYFIFAAVFYLSTHTDMINEFWIMFSEIFEAIARFFSMLSLYCLVRGTEKEIEKWKRGEF